MYVFCVRAHGWFLSPEWQPFKIPPEGKLIIGGHLWQIEMFNNTFLRMQRVAAAIDEYEYRNQIEECLKDIKNKRLALEDFIECKKKHQKILLSQCEDEVQFF